MSHEMEIMAAMATSDLFSAIQTLSGLPDRIVRGEIEDIELAYSKLGKFIQNYKQNEAERAWERHCEDFHDGGSTAFKSYQQQQIEAMKLK